MNAMVDKNGFTDAALVLIGHGSTLNEQSSATVFQHAAELRKRKLFAEVREAFWKVAPLLTDVVRSLTQERVFLVPFFVSEGYFTEVLIPEKLGFKKSGENDFLRVRAVGRQTQFYCAPVG